MSAVENGLQAPLLAADEQAQQHEHAGLGEQHHEGEGEADGEPYLPQPLASPNAREPGQLEEGKEHIGSPPAYSIAQQQQPPSGVQPATFVAVPPGMSPMVMAPYYGGMQMQMPMPMQPMFYPSMQMPMTMPIQMHSQQQAQPQTQFQQQQPVVPLPAAGMMYAVPQQQGQQGGPSGYVYAPSGGMLWHGGYQPFQNPLIIPPPSTARRVPFSERTQVVLYFVLAAASVISLIFLICSTATTAIVSLTSYQSMYLGYWSYCVNDYYATCELYAQDYRPQLPIVKTTAAFSVISIFLAFLAALAFALIPLRRLQNSTRKVLIVSAACNWLAMIFTVIALALIASPSNATSVGYRYGAYYTGKVGLEYGGVLSILGIIVLFFLGSTITLFAVKNKTFESAWPCRAPRQPPPL